MERSKELFDAYRTHPRADGVHYELAGRIVVENNELHILFDQYGNLRESFKEGPITPQTRQRMERYSNGYYALIEVERFCTLENLAAYCQTTYVAQGPKGGLRIRIGELTPELSESWTFVSVCNPGSFKPLPDDMNARRAQELEEAVRPRWPLHRGQGVPDRANREPEQSLLVLGISRDDAITLGREHGQNAIVFGMPGLAAELVECFKEG